MRNGEARSDSQTRPNRARTPASSGGRPAGTVARGADQALGPAPRVDQETRRVPQFGTELAGMKIGHGLLKRVPFRAPEIAALVEMTDQSG